MYARGCGSHLIALMLLAGCLPALPDVVHPSDSAGSDADVDVDADADADGDADPDSDSQTSTDDADGDGHTASSAGGDDCDDADPAVHPGAVETCTTSFDDDCDSDSNDLDATGCTSWYLDSDSDGYGTSSGQCTCSAAGDYRAAASSDCDDNDAAINPGAVETCASSGDDDCDGSSNDVSASGCTVYYSDADHDSYGASTSECVCTAEGAYTATNGTDCDDTSAAINPGAADVWYDGVDANCDGADDCDADGDGVAAAACGGADVDDEDPSIGICTGITLDGTWDGTYFGYTTHTWLPPVVMTVATGCATGARVSACDGLGNGGTCTPLTTRTVTVGDSWTFTPGSSGSSGIITTDQGQIRYLVSMPS